MTKRPNIYFSGSVRGGRQDQELYRQLIEYLQSYGRVLTEHVGDGDLKTTGEGDLPDVEIYRRDTSWIRTADLLVAEVTTPSLGVGYEIAVAEQRNVPVLCLHRQTPGRRLSAMIAGNERLSVRSYSGPADLKRRVDEFFASSGFEKS
jgi:hypothetical protein